MRYSERQNKYVLTCNWNGAAKHFVIQQIPDVSVVEFGWCMERCFVVVMGWRGRGGVDGGDGVEGEG